MQNKNGTTSEQARNKPARNAKGQLLPGGTANLGGRPALPAAFKAKGPAALTKLVAFMKDKDPRIALKATELVLARIYGNTTQPLEHDAGTDMLDAVAERIAQRMNGHS